MLLRHFSDRLRFLHRSAVDAVLYHLSKKPKTFVDRENGGSAQNDLKLGFE